MNKEDLIKLRSAYQPYEEAVKTQNKLIAIYKKEYKPKHTHGQYYRLIRDWTIGEVEERHPQDENYPDRVYECFSIVSQHVYGFTKEHCYDQIWDAVREKKKRIREYKKLPTLKELMESDIKIDPGETYNFREKDDYEDSCSGYSGDIILRMREQGIYRTQLELQRDSLKWMGATEEELKGMFPMLYIEKPIKK